MGSGFEVEELGCWMGSAAESRGDLGTSGGSGSLPNSAFVGVLCSSSLLTVKFTVGFLTVASVTVER